MKNHVLMENVNKRSIIEGEDMKIIFFDIHLHGREKLNTRKITSTKNSSRCQSSKTELISEKGFFSYAHIFLLTCYIPSLIYMPHKLWRLKISYIYLKKKLILQNHSDLDPSQNKTQNLFKFNQSVGPLQTFKWSIAICLVNTQQIKFNCSYAFSYN